MRRPPGSSYRLPCSRPLFPCLLPLPCPILILLFCTHLKTNFPLGLSSSKDPLFSFFVFPTPTLAGLSIPFLPCVHCCGSCSGPCNVSALPLSHTIGFCILCKEKNKGLKRGLSNGKHWLLFRIPTTHMVAWNHLFQFCKIWCLFLASADTRHAVACTWCTVITCRQNTNKHTKRKEIQAQWWRPVIHELERLRQEEWTFEASQCYILRLSQKRRGERGGRGGQKRKKRRRKQKRKRRKNWEKEEEEEDKKRRKGGEAEEEKNWG